LNTLNSKDKKKRVAVLAEADRAIDEYTKVYVQLKDPQPKGGEKSGAEVMKDFLKALPPKDMHEVLSPKETFNVGGDGSM
jgi:hypothetical protein